MDDLLTYIMDCLHCCHYNECDQTSISGLVDAIRIKDNKIIIWWDGDEYYFQLTPLNK